MTFPVHDYISQVFPETYVCVYVCQEVFVHASKMIRHREFLFTSMSVYIYFLFRQAFTL